MSSNKMDDTANKGKITGCILEEVQVDVMTIFAASPETFGAMEDDRRTKW